MIETILIFLAVLSVLVLVHELGHFVMARRMGMDVEEFGIGFPPRAWKIERDGVTYSINWIPLGGFVKIKGESGEHKDEPDSFSAKPAWQRFVVLVAGVVMNFVLAAVLLGVGFMIGLPSVVDDLPESARVSDPAVRIVQVVDDSPAAQAGLTRGDVLVSLDHQPVETVDQVRSHVEQYPDDDIAITVQKSDGAFVSTTVNPTHIPETDTESIGVGLVKTGLVSFPPHIALIRGTESTATLTVEIVRAFGGMIASLVRGDDVGADISGPVGIAVLTGEAAQMGFVYLLQFTAILSINLAVINILPFPALDGGRVLFLAIEKVRGRAADKRIEILTHNLGFMLLMLLVILVTYRDFVRFGDRIWNALRSLVGV